MTRDASHGTAGLTDGDRGEEDRKAFLLRLPAPLLAALRSWAAQDLRSLNAQIEWCLRDAVRRRGRERGAV